MDTSRYDSLRDLLLKGVDPNTKTVVFGYTPLHSNSNSVQSELQSVPIHNVENITYITWHTGRFGVETRKKVKM